MKMLIFGHSSLGTHRVSIGFLTRFHKRDNWFVTYLLCRRWQILLRKRLNVRQFSDPREGPANGAAFDR